jgi:hypothetical protein
MTLDRAVIRWQLLVDASLSPGTVTVGSDGIDTVYLYEHVRGLAKRRSRPAWLPSKFKVIYKFVGRVRPAQENPNA